MRDRHSACGRAALLRQVLVRARCDIDWQFGQTVIPAHVNPAVSFEHQRVALLQQEFGEDAASVDAAVIVEAARPPESREYWLMIVMAPALSPLQAVPPARSNSSSHPDNREGGRRCRVNLETERGLDAQALRSRTCRT